MHKPESVLEIISMKFSGIWRHKCMTPSRLEGQS